MKLNSSEYRGFLLGNIVGNSKLYPNGKFIVKSKDKKLILFKYKILKQYCNSQIEIKENSDKIILNIRSNEYLKKLYKKSLSNKLQHLTPLGRAIWFADCGTTILIGKNKGEIKNRRIIFCTDRYQYEDVLIIKNYIDSIYGNCFIIKRKNEYRIQLSLESVNRLFEEILPYFLKYFPTLLYKLDLSYDKKIENYYTKNIYNIIKSHHLLKK